MPTAVVRISKSKAAWETADPEQVMKANFRGRDGGWDLRPSVYEVSEVGASELEQSILRVHVEHVVSFLGPPAAGAMHHVDVASAVARLEASAGRTQFAFANRAHREVVLLNEEALRSLVETVLGSLPGSGRETSLDDVIGYIAGRRESDEWRNAASNSPVARWITLSKKKRPGTTPIP